ncbi:NADH-quinone oxidoreductase subunit NuoG [Candidatus Nitrosacidococcus tergens]|uniref:NADH-quinone oxidoreductase n=1 Tax=Candidatus Nitrosacidococcus tergens TaxID=553981 RepID=A0A7G1Q7T6_9GAMM|nr:NADH-quinone oxidoreductase subunit NuoG [Candidatus Nitrosacidococcus tergens]CAB1274583.1 NADH-quinone oxidoreductase, chain G [Candidatus Nitrosacidococcus tergens]
MVHIEIDGIKFNVEPGKMVIQVADEAGIYIPRFCYHKKLSVAANCRMCLIETDKSPKPVPACATPVIEGMKVFTSSAKAIAAQKGVMEFLLINHPLDCPICDQGGECELQDLAMGYGNDISRFTEGKRVVRDKDIGPLIQTELTRCIHCTRCIRFGEEIAGLKELGATDRGELMEIGTYIDYSLTSEVSGNVIDLCPVGALTDKPYRFKARAWEMTGHPAISPHDSMGTNIELHILRNQVMRVVPREDETINETWIADRDRYGCLGLTHEDRLKQPMVKQNGVWQEVDWEEALGAVAHGLRSIVEKNGGAQLGGLISPYATTEELYLFQKLLRGLHSNNIDSRLYQQSFHNLGTPLEDLVFKHSIEEIENSDSILLVGVNPHKDHPLLGLRFRKAAHHGAKIAIINPVDYLVRFPVAEKIITDSYGMIHGLAGIAKSLIELKSETLENSWIVLLDNIEPLSSERAIAKQLAGSSNARIFLGKIAEGHPNFPTLQALSYLIGQLTSVQIGFIPSGGNAVGAAIAGALPHQGPGGNFVPVKGLNWQSMFEKRLLGYLLLGIEPEFDCINPRLAQKALQDASFVVSLTAFRSKSMLEYSDILLPISNFTETSGTLINLEGHWQSFTAATHSSGDARPGWKVLRVLGNLLQIPEFEYFSSEEVCNALKDEIKKIGKTKRVTWYPKSLGIENKEDKIGLTRIAELPIYRVNSLIRRSHPLQQSPDGQAAHIAYLNSIDINKLGLQNAKYIEVSQEGNKTKLPFEISDLVAEGCIQLATGIEETAFLGAPFTYVQVASGE